MIGRTLRYYYRVVRNPHMNNNAHALRNAANVSIAGHCLVIIVILLLPRWVQVGTFSVKGGRFEKICYKSSEEL